MPTRTDPDTGKEYETIYVRAVSHMQTFHKDDLVYPEVSDFNGDEEAWKVHKDDPPRRRYIHVQGYDELGRPVCPVYEVESCEDVSNAIHNEKVRDARDRNKVLYSGRLVQVPERDLAKYPVWTGHPIIQDKPEEIHRKILAIRENQKLGDKLLNTTEESELYWLPDPVDDDDKITIKLRQKYIGWLANNPERAAEVNFDPKAAIAKLAAKAA